MAAASCIQRLACIPHHARTESCIEIASKISRMRDGQHAELPPKRRHHREVRLCRNPPHGNVECTARPRLVLRQSEARGEQRRSGAQRNNVALLRSSRGVRFVCASRGIG
eukprot:6176421-Pleurochrysis_carterae.AAC.1